MKNFTSNQIADFSGIKTEQVDSENLWHQLTTPETLPETNNSWSGMMVFGAIIVIPYLINRILKNLKNLSTPGKSKQFTSIISNN